MYIYLKPPHALAELMCTATKQSTFDTGDAFNMQTMLVSIWCLAVLLAALVSCHTPQSFPQIPLGISPNDRDIPVSRVPAEEWDALNKSVGGRLSSLSNLPLGLPCYDNYNGKPKQVDPLACSHVEKNKNNSEWLTKRVGGYVQVRYLTFQAHSAAARPSLHVK